MRTAVRPPRIPFLSSGRPVVLESEPTFSVAGLGAEGYDLRVEVASRTEGADFTVIPREFASLRLDPRGRRLPFDPEPTLSPEVANATQLFRDLTGPPGADGSFQERKWFVVHPSGFGVTRLLVDIRYQPEETDPATGRRRYRMTIEETPEEKARRRGFHAQGFMTLDPDGTLVSIHATGDLWKKVLFVTISVGSDYDVELLERRRPRGREEAGS